MQAICYTCSLRCACLLVCIAVATATPTIRTTATPTIRTTATPTTRTTATPTTRTTATPATRTLDPARNLRTGGAMRGNARNLLEILPSTPFHEAGTSASLPEVYEVEDDGSITTRISNVIKNLLDVAFTARETFGKMCNAFCSDNGLSTTCCQYVTNTIKSTSEFISDSETLENSRTPTEQLAAIVRLAGKYTNEISHVTAMVQSEPCMDQRVCPMSVDSCQEENMDTQFCSLVHMNQRMAAFSKSCQHLMEDMFPSQPTPTRDSHIAASQAAPTKLSKFTMDANRNLYTLARMIEEFNLIRNRLQSLESEVRTAGSLVNNIAVR